MYYNNNNNNNMLNQIPYASVYGEYNISVLKNGENVPYYPFGTGYQKNLITDQFLTGILLGWDMEPQSYMQVCRAGTGSLAPTRSDTFQTMTHNDETWASATVFARTIQTGLNYTDNFIKMRRDFIFNTLTSTRTYREAMVGILKTGPSAGIIQSDLAVSHFVFPSNITLQSGDRMVINYTLNIVLDYLHQSGVDFSLSGDGYDFSGKIKLMSNYEGFFAHGATSDPTLTTLMSPLFGGVNLPAKNIFTNSNGYSNYFYPSTRTLPQMYGTRSYNGIGFFGAGHQLSTYPNQFLRPDGANSILGPVANVTFSNLQVDANGASIDANYYFNSNIGDRTVNGIYLASRNSTETDQKCCMYLLFNNQQTIASEAPISMKLRWYVKRI